MNKSSLFILSVLFLSACGGNSGTNSSGPVDTGTSTEAATKIATGISRINGAITLYNNVDVVDDVSVRIRETDVVAEMEENGDFALELPRYDEDRTVVLDITGPNVVPDSILVPIPANALQVSVSADIAGRSPPIDFSLDNGGEMTNLLSKRRVSVTVPPYAFEFSDGTLAVGEAQVSISEVDIDDLSGASAWAPKLIGLEQGAVEPTVLETLGMSDFHFSQNGRELQLIPGKTATIRTDLVSEAIIPKGQTDLVEAAAGMAIPLWHYDTQDMIWKEEGESIVVADADSETGFALVGDVGHFSRWNHDYISPFTRYRFKVRLVDEKGIPYTDLEVSSFKATATVESFQGTYPTGGTWRDRPRSTNSKIFADNTGSKRMRLNVENRNLAISTRVFNAGSATMRFEISDVETVGSGLAELVSSTTVLRQTLENSEGTFSDLIVVDVPVKLITLQPVNVAIEFVDLFGNVRNDLSATSYQVRTLSFVTNESTQRVLTPEASRIVIDRTTQQRINAGEPVSITYSLDYVYIADIGEYRLPVPVSVTKRFNDPASSGNDYNVTLQVPIIDM